MQRSQPANVAPKETPSGHGGTQADRTAVLAVILASYLMIVLDTSIVITGLPKIQHDLSFSAAGLSWVQDAYLLVFGGLLLLGARMGDLLGRKRVLIAGLVLFTAASIIVGMAQTPAWMIAGRALQGLGSAIVAPSTLALLSITFPEGPERTRALAWYATTAGVAASIGLVLGGIFADWLSWRVGFFINLPVGLALIYAAQRRLQETERHSGQFDVAGAVSSALGMSALVFGTIHSATAGWYAPLTLTSFALGAASLVLFVVAERRAKQPITPLRLFADRRRSMVLAARFLYLGAMVGFWFFSSVLLQSIVGFTPAKAGFAYLPMTLTQLVAALAVPQITKRLGNERLLAGSVLVTLLGMAWLAQHIGNGYLVGVALPMILLGIGQSGALPSLTVAAVSGVTREDAGAASGLVNAVHQLGGSMGLALLTTLFEASGSEATATPAVLAHRLSTALNGATVMLALVLLLVATLIVRPRVETLRQTQYQS